METYDKAERDEDFISFKKDVETVLILYGIEDDGEIALSLALIHAKYLENYLM